MELIRFSIDKFRNFESKSSIDFKDLTVIVGPNNEGKTNICDALGIFFSQSRLMRNGRHAVTRSSENRTRFDVERDYPKSIKTGRRWPTNFEAEFALSTEDYEFLPKSLAQKEKLKVQKIWSYPEKGFKFKIQDLSELETKFTIEYIFQKINFISIPAVRDLREIEHLFRDVFNKSIQSTTTKSRKLKTVENLLDSIFKPEILIAKTGINQELAKFLNKDVSIDFEWDISVAGSVTLNNLLLDDGNPTSIYLKGDGIKSLLQIAFISRFAQIEKLNAKNHVYLIEEPEAHLNSKYIHELREKIHELSKKSKVVITTHSPIFVNLYDFESNNIVLDGKISKPKNKRAIADVLGVRLEENLSSNERAVYFEGEDDLIAFNAIMELIGSKAEIAKKCDLIPCYGASKIPPAIVNNYQLFKKHIVVLDSDKAGKDERKNIENISSNIVVFSVPVPDGYKEQEMEDLFDLDSQILIFDTYFGRKFEAASFKAVKKKFKVKWSDWVLTALAQQGLTLKTSESLKKILWENVGSIKLNTDGNAFFNSLSKTILLS